MQGLIQVTAYLLHFISNLRRSIANKELTYEGIKAEEATNAKELWCKGVQKSIYEDTNFEQVKASLSIFKDERGILRCGGHLKNTPIPYDASHPIFLTRCSHFMNLVIWDCHLKVLHNGVRDTLTELRSSFWVTKGRQAVKTVIGKCAVVRKLRAEAMQFLLPHLFLNSD